MNENRVTTETPVCSGGVTDSPAFRGWAPLIVAPAVTMIVTASSPRSARMWAIAISIFASLKWLTWRRSSVPNAPRWRQWSYLLAWPGMDADSFLKRLAVQPIAAPPIREWVLALLKTGLGGGLIYVAASSSLSPDPYLKGWLGMVGIVFTLHFGGFHLLSCVWRRAGIDARPLMNWPILSTSVSEFWGKRWNLAFRDLTHQFVFRPLARQFGVAQATWVGFLWSGIIHDVVISLPAGGGYGRPTAYFLIQAAAIQLERSRWGRNLQLGRGLRGWLFSAAVLVLPAPLLFHPPFVLGVINPFLAAIGAL